jgi:hypothetical protein
MWKHHSSCHTTRHGLMEEGGLARQEHRLTYKNVYYVLCYVLMTYANRSGCLTSCPGTACYTGWTYSQHACTADHNMPSLHQLALPCPSYIPHSLHTQTTLIQSSRTKPDLTMQPPPPAKCDAISAVKIRFCNAIANLSLLQACSFRHTSISLHYHHSAACIQAAASCL